MQPVFQAIRPDKQDQALSLWHEVFGVRRDFFTRYYTADPWYREGDTFGAWIDGTLVSAVHLCRRPLVWEGASLLCGGIANVATRPEYRNRGLSRRLLTQAIARMDEGEFAFSLLGTGIPDFYAAQGWESVQFPSFELTVRTAVPLPKHELSPPIPTSEIISLYGAAPRPLQQERPEQYFKHWVGWVWASEHTQLLTLERGYISLQYSDAADQAANVTEWRAGDPETEAELLSEAVAQARANGRDRVAFAGMPQHASLSVLEPAGVVEVKQSFGQMIRNVSLHGSEFESVRASFLSGRAPHWPGDGF